jgi:hypothetical protein
MTNEPDFAALQHENDERATVALCNEGPYAHGKFTRALAALVAEMALPYDDQPRMTLAEAFEAVASDLMQAAAAVAFK